MTRTRAIGDADVQCTAPGEPTRAVLVCGVEHRWRQRWRDVLQRLPVVVLLASRPAEAAKWLSDPRLVLIVAREDALLRTTVSTLAPAQPTVWLRATAVADDGPTDAEIDTVLERLSLPRRE